MNCKPGDLAVMVRSDFPENIGRLLRVIVADSWDGHDWSCEACCRVMTSRGWRKAGASVLALDSDLRPIRDPGDDAKDETLEWLPVPSKELA